MGKRQKVKKSKLKHQQKQNYLIVDTLELGC